MKLMTYSLDNINVGDICSYCGAIVEVTGKVPCDCGKCSKPTCSHKFALKLISGVWPADGQHEPVSCRVWSSDKGLKRINQAEAFLLLKNLKERVKL